MIIWLKGCQWAQVQEIWSSPKDLQDRFATFVDSVVCECLPEVPVGLKANDLPPLDPAMEDKELLELITKTLPFLLWRVQIHQCTESCYKHRKGSDKKCRSFYPKEKVDATRLTAEGILQIKRNHPRINGFLIWIIICLECNSSEKGGKYRGQANS